MTLVLDASILVKLFHREMDSEKAIELIDHANETDIEMMTSELAFYEVGNALFKHTKGTLVDGSKYLEELFRLDIDYVQISPASATMILECAVENGITFYDAVYFTLTDQHGAILVTEDKELLEKCPNTSSLDDALKGSL